ncbi:MAG: glycoside hydrolase family 43 protein [Bacteroidota bacterium]
MISRKIFAQIVWLSVILLTGCGKKTEIPSAPIVVDPVNSLAGKYPNPLNTAGADPGALYDNGNYYFYFTSGNGTGAMPIKWSSDLLSFTDNGARVFPLGKFPPWVTSGSYWAPEVSLLNGSYVCYYAAIGADGWFKIGVATAPSPAGPFTDKGTPLASNPNFSLIDPNFFHDPNSGKNYLLWKNNKNALSPAQPTQIVLQEISADGLSLVGTSTDLLVNDLSWEGAVIEAPSMLFRNGYYYIFYSANNYGTDKYAVGVARCTTIKGTYTKSSYPILQSDSKFDGPGGQSIVTNSPIAPYLIFYHARLRSNPAAGRLLMLDQMNWGTDNWPTVNDGTPHD